MPNHFHLLLSQTGNNGITDFLRLFENSYTRYFNTATKRIGPLLQGRFKAVHIETDEQLQHIVRYIHLNPYTSRLVDSTKSLASYPWSSYPSYLHNSVETQLQNEIITNQFNSLSYEDFVNEQGEYQRQLDDIKHLVLE